MLHKAFNNQTFWSKKWVRHIENYLSVPPRCGIWLRSRFRLKNQSVLECAGGSCRDSRYLKDNGVQSCGSDFDNKTLAYLEQRFSESDFRMFREDAFSMSFDNNRFDIIFHNGFWVLFSDNKDIDQLIREQARVAGRWAVALVHNKNNQQLVNIFQEEAKEDNIYKIRFFTPKELKVICEQSGINHKKISIEKFGGIVDILYAVCRRISLLTPVVYWLVPKLYRFQPWSKVERIAAVIELR